MLLEHLRTVFPLERRNAELGLDTVARNAGVEATENEASSRYTGAAEPRHTEANAAHSVPPGLETRSGDSRAAGGHLPHVDVEARRTVDAGEPRGHGRAACLWMGGHDDGYDHGHSTLGGRQAESGGIHVQCEFTGDPLVQSIYWSQFKKNISEGLGQVAVFSGLPDSAHLVPHHQSQEIEGRQTVRPGSSGQRSRTSTYARRSEMQAGGKGGQQLLISWIRPKMPSTVQSGTEDRGAQRLLTSWMRPTSSSAPTVYAAPVTAMQYISPAPEVCAATVPVVENFSPPLAVSYGETEVVP